MMIIVNSRPPPEGSSRGEIATLQIDTLRFNGSVGPTATTTTTKSDEDRQEQQLKTDVRGEAPGEKAWG